MADEDEFEPKLGRIRQQGGKRTRRYLGRVLAAANLARAGKALLPGARRFSGSRIGRGAAVGQLLGARGLAGAYGRRRVIVKASIVKLAGKGAGAAAAHLRYLQRDGTTRDGESGALYGRDSDAVDGKTFRERGAGDRHQFRFIVSPEDGADYDDLKPLTRRLMGRIEEDLGTTLDWVAVDHFNTGHPHTHIVVRGKDHLGADLVIARDYLTSGIRERAAELVDLDLGPRSARDVAAGLRAEIGQERLTSLDRALLRDSDGRGIVASSARSALDQTLRAGRLATLEKMGLAVDVGGGRWRLAHGLEETLRKMGERGDIIRSMQRGFAGRAIDRSPAELAIFDPLAAGARPLTGRLIERGLADEHGDRHYLLIDGIDGRGHYVAIGKGEHVEAIPDGAIVRIDPREVGAREADRTVATVAAANGGRYDVDAHLRHDPSASEAFAQTHVRRLEAMRRLIGTPTREASGQWVISNDHLADAEVYEAPLARDRPVVVEILSAQPLAMLPDADAATWLDLRLLSPNGAPLRAAGFGAEVSEVQEQRRRWLIGQGLAAEEGGRTTYAPGMVAALQRRELRRVAATLSRELELPFAEAEAGDHVEGVFRRRLDLVSGRFAVIDTSREFTLVPWRPILDRQVGKSVSGILRSDGISWSVGRGRGGPAIS